VNCTEVKDHLVEFVYGELTPPAREEVERHVADCSLCQSALRELRGAQRTLSALASADAVIPAASDARLVAGMVLRQDRIRSRWQRIALWSVTAAAILLLTYLASLRIEFHATHIVLAWGARPSSAAPATALNVQESLLRHEDHLRDVDRLVALIVRTLDAEGSRVEHSLATLRDRLAAVERRGDTRWRTVARILPTMADEVAAFPLHQ
jgi:anti-sigma factor RsiW